MKQANVVVWALIAFAAGGAMASDQVPQTPLPGKSIPKYVDPLPTFGPFGTVPRVQAGTGYTVEMNEFQQQVLPASIYASLPAPFNAGTFVWGYKVNGAPQLYPGVTVEAQRGTPVTVTYLNNLIKPDGTAPVLQKYITVDQTLHWADPPEPVSLMCQFKAFTCTPGSTDPCCHPFTKPLVPAVVHLHGGEVPSAFDGGPDEWFTPNTNGLTPLTGPGFVSNIYTYPNAQEATTLFFHDHTVGATRLNLYAGLAAFYFIRDNRDTGLLNNPIGLPAGAQEIELALQDRQFDTNGQLLFPDGSPCGINGCPPNPTVHPFWIPEFFGDVIVVNGKSWPFLNVEPRRYRFRIVDGSNARMYNLALQNLVAGATANSRAIWQIATDGGLLDTPVQLAYPNRLFLAPGERADVIVDFSGVPPGSVFTMTNNAKAPFPSGTRPDPSTVGQLMQFRVVLPLSGMDTTCNPAATTCVLRATPIVRLANPVTGTMPSNVTLSKDRQLVLKEIEGPGGPLEVTLNNTRWLGLKESTLTTTPTPIACKDGTTDCLKKIEPGLVGPWLSELPTVGSTEEWEIINITPDAHPIHLHLVQFQLINRQMFNNSAYITDWENALAAAGLGPGDGPPFPYDTVNADGAVGGNLAVGPYLQQGTMPPNPNEAGWKDTVVMLPGQVTRISVRWAPQDVPITGVAPGQITYGFDPTATLGTIDFSGNPGGPGYVWHCHIVDHEDNEMMRPYIPVCPSSGCTVLP